MTGSKHNENDIVIAYLHYTEEDLVKGSISCTAFEDREMTRIMLIPGYLCLQETWRIQVSNYHE